MKIRVAVLGCTGNIGQLCLEVISHLKDLYSIDALSAGDNIDILNEQINIYKPKFVSIKDSEKASFVKKPDETTLCFGTEGMIEIVKNPAIDLVIVATSGQSGLLPTLSAIEEHKIVVISNKEALVMGGELIKEKVKHEETFLRPVDIEHNAIWQCLLGEIFPAATGSSYALIPLPNQTRCISLDNVISKIFLPATGGAFFDLSIEQLYNAPAAQLMRDPSWDVLSKITVDSASLVNKAMEVVETHWLFGIPYEKIDVFIHRESSVHGMVVFADGNIKSKLGVLDMRFPIHFALEYPKRLPQSFKLEEIMLKPKLTFLPINHQRYPSFNIVIDAGRLGGTYLAALCGADEVAAMNYIKNKIGFFDIPKIIEKTLQTHDSVQKPNVYEIIDAYEWGKAKAIEISTQYHSI